MLATYKSLILDMDGVLWRGSQPIGDLPAIFRHLDRLGIRVVFATNNSTRTVEQFVDRLKAFGVIANPWQVITSSLAAAHILKERFPHGGNVFAIGESGLFEALQAVGFHPTDKEDIKDPVAVVMGADRQINFQKLRTGTLLVRSGIPFYATNPDKTYPTPEGEIPGAGALISVLVTASGITPTFAGKPGMTMLEMARQRLGTAPHQTLVVGDRLDTDIAGGQAAGLPTALVLTGISGREEGLAWQPQIDIIIDDLTTLVGLS